MLSCFLILLFVQIPHMFLYRLRYFSSQSKLEKMMLRFWSEHCLTRLVGECAKWEATREATRQATEATREATLVDAAAALAAHAGWRIERRWIDPHQQIALHLLLPAN